jgi:iron complex outermembrane receptor protein
MVSIGAVVAAPTALGQPVSTPSDEIVVTAPLEGQKGASLSAVEVLSREQVVEALNSGLGETLDALPGVSSSYFGAGASRPIIRGLGEDRVRILQNGIGSIDAASASPDHAPTSEGLDAQRIEVLRGTAALAYGGNAVGGVINVLDGSIPTRAPENGLAANGLAGYTSVDEGWQAEAGATIGSGPFAFHLSAAGREADAFDIPGFARSTALRAAEPLPPGDVEAVDTAPNSFVNVYSYGAGGSFVGDWGFVGLAVKQHETDYGLPPEEAGAVAGPTIDLEQTRIESRGDFNGRFGPFDRLDYGVQWSDYTHQEIEDTGEVATTFTNEGFEARVEAHHAGFSDKLDGAIGFQVTDTDFNAVGEEAFLTATTTSEYGAFIIERWDTGDWGVEGGLRAERRDLENAVAGDVDFTSVSASAGAFLRSAEGWFLGATLSRTERAPTQFELFADGPHVATGNYERGDSALDKETALTVEGTARYTSDRWRLEASLYRATFQDYIALLDTGLVFDETNEVIVDPSLLAPGDPSLPVFDYAARDAVFAGGEVFVGGTLAETGGWKFTGDAAVDYVRAEFDAGGDVPRIPARTLTLGLGAQVGAFALRAEAIDVDKQDNVAAFETPTDGYTLYNARLTSRPPGADNVRIILDGRNLTDEEAREHASFLKDKLPRPGRNVRLVVSAGF